MERLDLSENGLATLVEAFYARVRADAELGPIFDDAIDDRFGTRRTTGDVHINRNKAVINAIARIVLKAKSSTWCEFSN